ncbi:septum formation family protein [Dietzia sp.]|uniref:septum formation family protein n=1 Tax=Dietzia sp. TaxID=1871616 RepID=UPI002FD993AD
MSRTTDTERATGSGPEDPAGTAGTAGKSRRRGGGRSADVSPGRTPGGSATKPAGRSAKGSSGRAQPGRRRNKSGATALARSRGAVAASVVALGIGAAISGTAIGVVMKDPDSTAAGPVNVLAPQVNPRTLTSEAFAVAGPGECLDWQSSDRGQPTDITAVQCEQPHRFEVAERVDLAEAVGNEPYPEGQRRLDLASQVCTQPMDAYTAGRAIDPAGRFSRALIPPSRAGWDAGDRSALCGIAAKELDGTSATSEQPYAVADQQRLWPQGTCVGISDQRTPSMVVDCAADHAFEVVGNVDVTQLFPEGSNPPAPADQTAMTADACYNSAVDYLGGDSERLRQSTLVPAQILPISQIAWETGSRTVNCAVMRVADPGPFAVIQGSVRNGVTIEGQQPEVPTTTEVPAPGQAQPGSAPAGDGEQAPAAVPTS